MSWCHFEFLCKNSDFFSGVCQNCYWDHRWSFYRKRYNSLKTMYSALNYVSIWGVFRTYTDICCVGDSRASLAHTHSLSLSLSHAHTQAHTRTRTYTNTHTHIHTHTHAHTHTHTHTQSDKNKHTHTRTHTLLARAALWHLRFFSHQKIRGQKWLCEPFVLNILYTRFMCDVSWQSKWRISAI